ncbi:hypothetical protein BMS3Bbin04_01956 [bacterium BMS3Bbin04]|nr:hypothetical protein BMS3Bbin04_01956 [bacterium BMS3Bbin04]
MQEDYSVAIHFRSASVKFAEVSLLAEVGTVRHHRMNILTSTNVGDEIDASISIPHREGFVSIMMTDEIEFGIADIANPDFLCATATILVPDLVCSFWL